MPHVLKAQWRIQDGVIMSSCGSGCALGVPNVYPGIRRTTFSYKAVVLLLSVCFCNLLALPLDILLTPVGTESPALAYMGTAAKALWQHPYHTADYATFHKEFECWFAFMATSKPIWCRVENQPIIPQC